jgi:oxidoreductase
VEQKVIDFERLEEAGLKEGQWDVIFIAMGTTAKSAGSQENFTKIDKEYVVNAAKAAKADKDQRLIYVSVSTANPKSSVFYSRSKALTEQALADLGYKDTIVFRPAVLSNTNRQDTRLAENALLAVTGVLSRFSSKVQIDVDKLAKSIRIVGEQGTSDLPSGAHAQQTNWGGKNFTMIDNSSAVALSH